jgi:hypothetical protein
MRPFSLSCTKRIGHETIPVSNLEILKYIEKGEHLIEYKEKRRMGLHLACARGPCLFSQMNLS